MNKSIEFEICMLYKFCTCSRAIPVWTKSRKGWDWNYENRKQLILQEKGTTVLHLYGSFPSAILSARPNGFLSHFACAGCAFAYKTLYLKWTIFKKKSPLKLDKVL